MTLDGVSAFLQRRIIYAPMAAGTLWICYIISLLLGPQLGTFNFQSQLVFPDHLAFYTAARLIHEGQPDKVYNYEFVAQYQAGLFPPGKWDSLEAFRNPPFYALLYYPTAQWPFAASSWFWTFVSIGLLAISVHWLANEANTPNRSRGRLLLWCLSFYPVFAAISYGQNSLLSTFVFAATYRLLCSEQRFLAGLVAGLLWFKPPLLLGLIVWGLIDLRRLWPAALGVIVTGFLLTAGSYPIVPIVWQGFVDSLRSNVAFDNFEQFKMHNPVAFWRILLPFVSNRIHWILAGISFLLAFWVFFRLWQKRRNDLAAMFGAAVFFTLWASPHSLIYEWSILVVPGILWLRERYAHPRIWFLLYCISWTVLFIGTHFTEGMLLLQKWLLGAVLSPADLADQPQAWVAIGIQLSVALLAWVGWKAAVLLGKNETQPSAAREKASEQKDGSIQQKKP